VTDRASWRRKYEGTNLVALVVTMFEEYISN
jgi:hypothetical protein